MIEPMLRNMSDEELARALIVSDDPIIIALCERLNEANDQVEELEKEVVELKDYRFMYEELCE